LNACIKSYFISIMSYLKRVILLLIFYSTSLDAQKQYSFRSLDSYDLFFRDNKEVKKLIQTVQTSITNKQSLLFGDNVGDKFHSKVLLQSLVDNLHKANISDECKNDINIFYLDVGGYLDENSSYANHSKVEIADALYKK